MSEQGLPLSREYDTSLLVMRCRALSGLRRLRDEVASGWPARGRPSTPNTLLLTLVIIWSAKGSLERVVTKFSACGDPMIAPKRASASWSRLSSALR